MEEKKNTVELFYLVAPRVFPELGFFSSWNEWLEHTEKELVSQGYVRYKQNLKREDFAYWKSFSENGKKVYQVGLLFYDFRKYQKDLPERIGVQFECLLMDVEGRIDLSVSKDISLKGFETIARTFYESLTQYCD